MPAAAATAGLQVVLGWVEAGFSLVVGHLSAEALGDLQGGSSLIRRLAGSPS